jgi:magnesium-protoporphyrin O-methyltransferase
LLDIGAGFGALTFGLLERGMKGAVAVDASPACYPACEALLEAATGRAQQCVALSYPRDVWYVRLGMMLENAQRRLARNSFRAFVHPIDTIEQTIRRAGFELSSRRETWMWSADVYVRLQKGSH